jgi:hypothetical protein
MDTMQQIAFRQVPKAPVHRFTHDDLQRRIISATVRTCRNVLNWHGWLHTSDCAKTKSTTHPIWNSRWQRNIYTSPWSHQHAKTLTIERKNAPASNEGKAKATSAEATEDNDISSPTENMTWTRPANILADETAEEIQPLATEESTV